MQLGVELQYVAFGFSMTIKLLQGHTMTEDDVRKHAFAMPLTSPAYPPGPYRFVDRQFLIVSYRTDPDVLAAVTPRRSR